MPKQAGNSIATAFDITTIDTNIKIFEDTISNTDSLGYYKFTIAENSKLNIKLSGLTQNVNLFLLNADGSQITQSAASGNADENIVQNLRAGSYYFYVGGGGTGTNYKIETSATSLGPIPVDNAGNTFDTAKNLGTLGTTAVVANDFVGNFNGLSTDDIDYYQFTIAENSTINLKLSGLSQNAALYLFDSQQGFVQLSVNAGNADENITKNLRAGIYYAYVSNGGNITNYKFEASAISLGTVPADNAGNSFERAKNLGTLGTTAIVANDFIGNFNGLATDDTDYYQFTINENSTVNLKLSGLSQNAALYLFDSQQGFVQLSVNAGNADENITKNLRAGTYYVYASNGGDITNYQFEASAVSLGAVPADNAGDSFGRAKNLGVLGTTAVVANDSIGNFNGLATDDIDYYQFTIAENSTVNLKLSGLSQNAALYLFDSQQGFVQLSVNAGNADENITKNLRAGTYYVYASNGGDITNYQFEASAVSLGAVPADNAGDSFGRAKNLGVLGTTAVVANDSIGNFNGLATDDIDYYQFTIAENSTVNLKLSGLSQNAALYLFDSQQGFVQLSVNAGNADENITKNLRAGTYYVYASNGGNITNYQFEASAVSLGAVPADNAGDSFGRAKNLGVLGTTAVVANDSIGNFNGLATDDIDYYQFTIAENSTVNLKLSGLSQNAALYLFDSQQGFVQLSVNAGNADENITKNLRAGTYYVYASNGGNITNYQFEASAVSLGNTPIDNNPIYQASDLGILGSVAKTVDDQVGSSTPDYYKFTLTENSTINLKLSDLSQDASLQLFSNTGVNLKNSLQSGTADENISQNLKAGTYYLQVNGGGTGTTYKLDASAVSLGAVPIDNAGQNIDTAKDLGVLTSTVLSSTDYLGNFNGLASDNSDYYKFVLTESSTVNLKLSGLSQNASLQVFSNTGSATRNPIRPGTSDEIFNLRAGTYYVLVSGGETGTTYKLDASAVSLGAVPIDNAGQNIDTAKDLGVLTSTVLSSTDYVGNFNGLASDNSDYYKFVLTESSTVNLKLSGLSQNASLQVFSNTGSATRNPIRPGTSDEIFNLRAGTYYVLVSGGETGTTYKLDASAVSLGAVPIDNAGQNIDTAKDLGVLTSTVLSSTDYLGNFNGLASDNSDYYKFVLTESSTVNLKLSGLSQNASLQVFSNTGSATRNPIRPGTSDEIFNLRAGTYYVLVSGGETGTTYKLDASAVSLGAVPVDNAGQTIDTAKDLGVLTSTVLSSTDYVGNFNGLASDNNDYYKFTLTENSTINLNLSGLSQDASLQLFSNTGTNLNNSFKAGTADENISQNLRAGTYYLNVSGGGTGTTYKLDASAVSLGAFPVDNAGQTIDSARDLGVISDPQKISDYIGNFSTLSNDTADYYKFRVTSDSLLQFNLGGITGGSPNLQLFNSSGRSLSSSRTGISQGITAGTYYLAITPTVNTGTSYELDIANTPIPDFAGSNNKTARDVGVLNGARTFTDFVGSIDYADVYRFELKEKSSFNLNFNPERLTNNTSINLTNAKGQYLGNVNRETNSFAKELDAGVYYAGIYNYGGANSDTNYNLNLSAIAKQNSAFQILSVNPIAGSNQGEASIDIKGTKFTPTAKVSIVDPTGKEVISNGITVLNDTSIAAKFDLKGQVIGAYDVKVVDGTNQALANDIYLVNDLAPGRLQVDIAAPGAVRPGAKGELIITYRNAGNTDIPAPLLTLVAKGALLEESGEYKDGTIQFLGINKEGNAGVLPAGATGSVRVKFRSALDATNIDFQVNSLALDENVDWNGIKDSSRPEGIAADVWDKIYSNFVTSVGGKASEFQKVLDDNANRLSQLGEYTGDISRLLSFELQQVNSNAISARSTVGAFGRGGVNPWDVTAITDAVGNVAIQTGDRRRTFTKGKDGKYQGITDDLGSLTKVGDVYQIKEFDGTIQSFLADGKLDFIQDTNQNKVTLGYTDSQLTGLSYSNGDKVSFKYNPQGRVNEVVDIYGQSTTYTYDAAGEQLLSVSDVSGTVSYTYETVGAKANAIKSITYPDGTQSLFEYDDLGRVTQESLNGGEQTLKYSYDSTGGVTVTDANNKSTQVLLNDRGQVAQTTDALGRVSRFSYDSKGNLTQVLAPDSSNAKFTYDSKGNLLASTDALGQSVQFAYDSRYDQIKSVTDQKGNAINYTYDDKGNLGSIGYADGSKESFTYSTKGDVTVSSNRRGQEISYTYDSRGLLTKKGFADGTSAAFEYDVRGNLTKATDADSSVTYGYDVADRLTNVSYGGTRSLSFSYDAGGRRSKMVDQDGFATNYSYDSVGRLKQLTDKDAKSIVSYSYNTLGQLSREDNGNGTYTTYTYDDAGQALSIVNYKADNSINSRYDYTYNQLGQRTSMTTLEGKTSYGYDGTGQLTSVALASGRNIEYKYDAAGNRITVKDSATTTNYSTNNLNQYTTVGTDAYTYDKDGNLTSKTSGGKTSSFSYDIENRLIGVTNPDGTWQYQYDALGNRIGSTFNGQKTDYLLDPTGLGDVVGEYTGSQATRYSHGLGLASRNDGTNTSFFDTDAIGSVVGLSGTGGNYLNSYSYLPFGESLTKTETVANSFEYVGQYGVMNEANGLDFMRARFYTPGEGRFLNPDPIGVNGGINIYSYVINNPLTFVDDSGTVGINKSPNLTTTQKNQKAQDRAQNKVTAIIPASGGGPDDDGSGGGKRGNKNKSTTTKETGNKLNVVASVQDTPSNSVADGFTQVGGVLIGISPWLIEFAPVAAAVAGSGAVSIGIGAAIRAGAAAAAATPILNPGPAFGETPGGGKSDIPYKAGITIIEKLPPATKTKPAANANTQAVFPFDPNDIIGPNGTGPDRWLTPDPILPYTIRFENVATATAPAVLVNITHTLDSDLDLNTFELGDFGFGSTTITVPDGLQNYTTRLDLRDTIGDYVDFIATLDTATRLVTWKIITIDPLTGEPAEGVTDGFLPPNNANRDGDGFVNYRIKAKSDTPNGASLDAQASIVFDTNAAIVTPIWSNKIDTNAPTSKVQTLAATTAGKDLTVTWAGTDDGSGVGKYDVYVAIDGGAYTLWQTKTDKTSGTYTGEIGKTYSFYSIATDGVGRTETKTATAETTTKLIELPTVPTIPTITISVTDADLAETPTGQPANPGQFTLTRTGATTADLTVNYTIAGTATNGTDYQTLGSVTFAAGKDTAIIDLNVLDDNIYEGTETVTLSLTANPAYIIPAAPSPSINIADNDTKPTISVANITQPEGNSGNNNYAFNLTLSNPSVETITVKYTTADDTATAGTDYTAATDTVTFNPGETSKIVNVVATGDTLFEADETFKLNLTDAVNATILTTAIPNSKI